MEYTIGIAGSTVESVAAIADSSGRILAAVNGAPLNLQELRAVDFYRNFSRAIDCLLKAANVQPTPAQLQDSAFCCSIEGLVSDEDIRFIQRCTESTVLHDTPLTVLPHRGLSAYLATFGRPRGDAVVVKCGTGAFAFGMRANETILRAGGWGPYTGDDGGGFSIGLHALEKVFRELDGRAPRSQFGAAFCSRLGAHSELDLIRWLSNIRERHLLKSSVANIAIVVASSAAQNDPIAIMILENAADRMFESLRAVANRLELDTRSPVINLQGGVIQHTPHLWQALHRRVRDTWSGARVVRSRYRPVIGTLMQGIDPDERLASTEALLASVDTATQGHRNLLLATYAAEIVEDSELWTPGAI